MLLLLSNLDDFIGELGVIGVVAALIARCNRGHTAPTLEFPFFGIFEITCTLRRLFFDIGLSNDHKLMLGSKKLCIRAFHIFFKLTTLEVRSGLFCQA